MLISTRISEVEKRLTACFLLKKSSLLAAEASSWDREYVDLGSADLACMFPVDCEGCNGGEGSAALCKAVTSG